MGGQGLTQRATVRDPEYARSAVEVHNIEGGDLMVDKDTAIKVGTAVAAGAAGTFVAGPVAGVAAGTAGYAVASKLVERQADEAAVDKED